MRKREMILRIDPITIERHDRHFVAGDYKRISEQCNVTVTTVSTCIAKRTAPESVYRAIQAFYLNKEKVALELSK